MTHCLLRCSILRSTSFFSFFFFNDTATTEIYTLSLHDALPIFSSIGFSGFPVGEMLNIDYADVDQAAKTLAENPELALGIKVRETIEVVGTNGLEPLKRAILACERSGVRGARVMCHIGNAPGELSALLDLLRPGDILTHA